MDHFFYKNGALHAEDVALSTIAEAVGTPFYCYSTATLERHYRVFATAFSGLPARIFYSVKANSNQAVLKTLANLGSGADVVSEGELRRAQAAGIPAERIVFSGVGKTADEIAFALDQGIYQFNVESEPELAALSAIAHAKGLVAPVSFRINPDIAALTHAKISTGKKENKFGIPWRRVTETFAQARGLPGIRALGLDIHIGSQLTKLEPFEDAFRRVAEMVTALRADGHAIERIDLGGGLGITYGNEQPPAPDAYAQVVRDILGGLDAELLLEPGRLLIGNAGILVSRVIYVKDGDNRRFVILDSAMNDLLRPALYNARHVILPVLEPAAHVERKPVDIVGPVCETGDTFATEEPMPPLQAGDLVVMRTAGAYGAVMASSYNSRLLVPEVMVKGAKFAVIRPRPDYATMIGLDRLPDWL